MKWKYFVILPILAAALGGLWAWKHTPEGPVSINGMTSTTGPELLERVKALNSPVVMVNFWASWCTPCRAEFPSILALKDKLKDQGFQVIFVSIDEKSELGDAADFLKQSGVTFPTYFKAAGTADLIKDVYPQWQGAVPTSLLFGPGSKLLDAWEGDATAGELETKVRKHLKGT